MTKTGWVKAAWGMRGASAAFWEGELPRDGAGQGEAAERAEGPGAVLRV